MIELIKGNIVDQEVDVIVNAANRPLYVGSGVDGAIHDAGGPSIHEETSRLYPEGCPTGSAVVSGAGNLPAKYVFHAVGPVWIDTDEVGRAELLKSTYLTCLELAVKHNCQSIAFPAISTGAYGYPIEKAAKVAIETVRDFLKEHKLLVKFVLFDQNALDTYAKVHREILGIT